MSYKRKYSIFISSTYEDMIEERQEVLGVALECDFIPVGMEQFHAYPASQWDLITKMIDECDCYLLIIGGCYGTIDKASGISYTEKEYNYARDKGIPVLALIRKPEAITQDKMDTGDDRFEKQKKLEEFRKRVNNDGNTTDRFGSIEDLKYRVSQSLRNAKEFCGDKAGWVRYSELQSMLNEKIEEKNKENATNRVQQESAIESMQEMLTKFANELEEVKNNQLAIQEIEPISKEDIEKMFEVEGETLKVNPIKK